MKYNSIRLGLAVLFIAALVGCGGDDGAPGATGATGDPGAPGTPGVTGAPGATGATGGNFKVSNFHGEDYLAKLALETANKVKVDATITSATAAADGTVTVNFTVKDKAGKPVTDLDPASLGASSQAVNATVASLNPTTNQWEPYFYTTEGLSNWPQEAYIFDLNGVPQTNVVAQATTSSGAINTLTNNGGGAYTLVLGKKILGQVEPNTNSTADFADGETIAYDRARTHRVSIQFGGHNGYTDNDEFDFVPDGSAGSGSRNIVSTTACNQCHVELAPHGGSRQEIETCVTCHNPSTFDASSDSTMDAQVLFHKIHMGSSLKTDYKFGHRGNLVDPSHIGFPAKANTCQKCHYEPEGETLANVDNWKTKPSRVACGSCHDDVDFASGTNHAGGAQSSDAACTFCHGSTGTQVADGQSPAPVPDVHYSFNKAKLTPEYTADITVSGDGGDGKFDAGEAPLLTIVIKDGVTGVPIDHTTMTRDTKVSPNLAKDGQWKALGLYVSGPKAKRMPVLTTTARASVKSAVGPFDLGATGRTLTLTVDGGGNARLKGADGYVTDVSANLSATLPCGAAGNPIANCAAATAAEVAAALNANASFKARAKAGANADGSLSVWSRNVTNGNKYSTQVTGGTANAALLFPATVATTGGSTPGNNLFNANLAAGTVVDPKATFSAANITYQLDPVDDLIAAGRSGTYSVRLEFSDYGRGSDVDYVAPSFGNAYIQVGTTTEEKLVANTCNRCHQDFNGLGLAKDSTRHNVTLDNNATDDCGSCHDYQTATGNPADGWSGWDGAKPLARRVHALHNSAALLDRKTTIGYSAIASHPDWDKLTIPTDVRNCQVCHSADTTGSWKTNPNRIACYGCHDSEAAKTHFKTQTFDPTPADAFSGDETEACQACHGG